MVVVLVEETFLVEVTLFHDEEVEDEASPLTDKFTANYVVNPVILLIDVFTGRGGGMTQSNSQAFVASQESNGAYLTDLGFASRTHYSYSPQSLETQSQFCSSSPFQHGDSSWCVDFGVTNHITSNLNNFSSFSLQWQQQSCNRQR